MSTFENQDPEIQSVMNHTPMAEGASDELKRKLRLLAAQTPPRRLSPWPGRLMFAGAALAGIGVVALTMMPAKASAYERVMQAAAHAHTFRFQITSRNGQDGGEAHHVDITGADGKFLLRAEGGALVQLGSDGKMEIYNPKENTVLVLSAGSLIDGKQLAGEIEKGLSEGLKELDLQKMLKDYEKQYGKENIHVGPILQRSGESTYQIDLSNPKEPTKIHMTVNADNDLPKRIEMEKRGEDGNWVADTQIELSFGDPSIDVPNATFPANAKRVELNLDKMLQQSGKNFDPFKGFHP